VDAHAQPQPPRRNTRSSSWCEVLHIDDATLISFTMPSLHILHDESMRNQQGHLLLGLFLGEKERIFSHFLYDVAGVEDGTIMVQRGYSLTFDVQELLPPWERFHMCNNIIGGLPIYVEEAEGNNAVPFRDYLVPHVEEGGTLAPGRGILASLQGSPQDLMYGGQGTIHVPLLRRCGTMETQSECREKT